MLTQINPLLAQNTADCSKATRLADKIQKAHTAQSARIARFRRDLQILELKLERAIARRTHMTADLKAAKDTVRDLKDARKKIPTTIEREPFNY